MSITASATSPTTHTPSHQSRSSVSSVRTPRPGSIGQNMAPLLTQTHMSPHGQTPTASSKVRSPSPNYFGFQTSSSTLPVSTYNGQHARQNWSPPSSTVRSTAAFSPTYVPVDQNPDFAAFRRQSEGMSRAFNLSTFPSFSQDSSPVSPKSDKDKFPKDLAGTPVRSKVDAQVLRSPPMRPGPHVLGETDSFALGRSPKRHLSSDSTNFPNPVRKASPATSGEGLTLGSGSASVPPEEAQAPLFALPPPPLSLPKARAETLPPSNLNDQSLVTPQHVVNLLEANTEEILILDLRISTQYAKSRIPGALNLCIPTTLIKRPSFNVNKLAETFKSNEQRTKFEKWRNSKYIIVYDASASQLKDAAVCLNTIKKFESEGYDGIAYIIKGGFAEFAKSFPSRIDKQSDFSTKSNAPGKITMPGSDAPLPVIGGCPMPATKSAANPFFGNIRQNMDLIGGVGQMPVKRPADITEETLTNVPDWLRRASKVSDNGAQVSDKFLQIEKREQKRMQDALSGEVHYGSPSVDQSESVQIAGIEKGAKNRYNNIWPFEHSRVKLEDVPNNGCDYVNANHIQSSLSHKRYIATQGPIPATFADFWNVVWQQDVRVIVMLTAEQEGGQVKAHDYWSGRQYGPFRLELISSRKATLDPAKIHRHRLRQPSTRKSSIDKPNIIRNDSGQEASASRTGTVSIPPSNDEPYITVRRLTLSHDGFPFQPIREITQIQYASWPDFGAPAHPSHLLGLVEQCDAVVRSLTHAKHTDPDSASSRPVLVHCSAGCGRTGTFCTVDSVIDMLKRQRNASRARETRMSIDASDASSRSPKTPKTPSRFFNDVPDSNPFFSPMQLSSSPVKASMDDVLSSSPDPIEEGSWVQENGTDLIEKSVEDFRRQRLSMVQSLRQFVLCYETVLEWVVEEERRAADL
ncbi:hypothetical protein K461DRAFT_137880 [Myriangium duriaei CBS 260.36]|uniref:protein-tyrosine-phosphatase n=1 Tax=Myriangium duriaei CBS 260.36 TaxID=1168546 RepID=A0A9P4J4U9_9PEZI|nr:hypothetical protein K461DRAFT_137880 [Myriangium duriaei CBS 260.36]